MKAARVDDIWRGLAKRTFEVKYTEVRFSRVRRLGSGRVPFKPGISAIIGGNGVGKSTLMSTIVRSLGAAENSYTATLFDLPDAEIRAALTVHGVELTTTLEDHGVAVAPTEGQLPGYYVIDPSTSAGQLQRRIREDAVFKENLEGVEPAVWPRSEVDLLSYIVGKNYTEIRVYEIDYADTGEIPYFEVVCDGVHYDSAQMGLGELSLFLIYWRLRAIDNDAIVLIEEPETHVSPRSQGCLMNVCADLCRTKGLSVILTTHSPFIITRVPRDHICLLRRDGENLAVIEGPTHDQIARILGDRLNYHGVVLVEDELAKAVARAILRALSADLLEYYEFLIAGSVDEIRTLLRFPKNQGWFSLIGLFDGDQRAALAGVTFGWPRAFLPGDEAPDMFLQRIINDHRNDVAVALRVEWATLDVACEAAIGYEGHEWLRKVRQGLALDIPAFADAIVGVALSDDAVRAECSSGIVKTLRENAFAIAHAPRQPSRRNRKKATFRLRRKSARSRNCDTIPIAAI